MAVFGALSVFFIDALGEVFGLDLQRPDRTPNASTLEWATTSPPHIAELSGKIPVVRSQNPRLSQTMLADLSTSRTVLFWCTDQSPWELLSDKCRRSLTCRRGNPHHGTRSLGQAPLVGGSLLFDHADLVDFLALGRDGDPIPVAIALIGWFWPKGHARGRIVKDRFVVLDVASRRFAEGLGNQKPNLVGATFFGLHVGSRAARFGLCRLLSHFYLMSLGAPHGQSRLPATDFVGRHLADRSTSLPALIPNILISRWGTSPKGVPSQGPARACRHDGPRCHSHGISRLEFAALHINWDANMGRLSRPSRACTTAYPDRPGGNARFDRPDVFPSCRQPQAFRGCSRTMPFIGIL